MNAGRGSDADRTPRRLAPTRGHGTNRTPSRYLIVEADLRNQITSGALRPSDRLPNEVQMSAMYGVSRSVIRQALNNLQRDGLVMRMRARGTFVSKPSLAIPVESLSSFADELRSHGIAVTSRVLVVSRLQPDHAVRELLQIERGLAVDYVERLRLGDDDILAWDATWLHPSLRRHIDVSEASEKSFYALYERAGRRAEAVARRVCAVSATRELAQKMGLRAGAPLMRIERVTRDAAGSVLDFQVRVYRGERFSLALGAPAAAPTLAEHADTTWSGGV